MEPMMLRTRSISLFVFLACFATMPALVKADDPDPDPIGHYLVDGKTPDGTPYSQQLHIRRDGEVYHLKWTHPVNKDYMREGVGVLKDGKLAVAWNGSSQGVGLFSIETVDSQTRLVGRWTYMDPKGKVGHEVARYVRK
jgi:hypothetical protein